VARARERPSGLTLLVLTLAMIAAALLLAYWSRGEWFSSDDLKFAVRLGTEPFDHALVKPPPNKYLIAFPMLFYKVAFETFGIGSYVPYRITGILLVLLCAALLFTLLRRWLPDRFAIPPTLLMLFFGAGWGVVVTPTRIPSQFALAGGLAAILALERRDRRGDLAAMVLIGISLASHPLGISFAAVAVLMIVLSSRDAWRRLWVVAIPGALFGAWWFFIRVPNAPSLVPNRPADVFEFVRQSWAALVAAVSGLFGVLDQPAYHQPLAWIAAAALLALLAIGIAFGRRRLPPIFWASLLGLVVLMATTRLAPAGFFRVPDESRYLYPEAFFLLISLGVLAGTLKVSNWVMWVASAVLLISLWPNINRLHDGGRDYAAFSDRYRVAWSAAEIARPSVKPEYRPDGISPTAAEYLATVRDFGAGGYSPAALSERPEALRYAADVNLVAALGLGLVPAGRAPATGSPPRVEGPSDATTTAGCVTVPKSADMPQRAFRSIEFRLPSGGVWLSLGVPRVSSVRLGRFADQPLVSLPLPPGALAADLRIPPDRARDPWSVLVRSRGRITVCGLGSPS
jgi:hypothetical protein